MVHVAIDTIRLFKIKMGYSEDYKQLKNIFNYSEQTIRLNQQFLIHNLDFQSTHFQILTGDNQYNCEDHHVSFQSEGQHEVNQFSMMPDRADSEVTENRIFKYHLFKPDTGERSKQIVLLFHGFNEKYWHKYLPWAKRIMEVTGKSVVLFPIAFHMNRSPHSWSEKKVMYLLSEERKKQYPDILHSSISNAAISARLQTNPQRFFWSGLQTYADVMQFIEMIKEDKHPLIAPDASIDFFSYSIGSLLAQILMMTNPGHHFDKSRLCMFCGGAVFNRMSPVTRFILDSEANVALYSYVIEHIESHLIKNKRLGHFLSEQHPEGFIFRYMLNYNTYKTNREKRFKELSSQLTAITLEKDTVVPPYEVMNTLQGAMRNIPVKIHNFDFPYDYKHEDPFPCKDKIKDSVDAEFDRVFSVVCDFLKC